ncbi:MAG TPA: hypothetical protein VLE73_01290 [Candidatus Saccharimonadales bacterium]|nr:hypothetical protein [Candidatus Saccharimonadales bacterium]
MTKLLIWIGITVGSALGGWIGSLMGGGLFGWQSILLSTLGAFAGIYAGYKLGQYLGG